MATSFASLLLKVVAAAAAAAAATSSAELDERAAAAAAAPWRPVPPCAPPLGVAEPAVPEAMCSRQVAAAGAIVVREIGAPVAETLVTLDCDSTVWYDALATGVEMVLGYFAGNNDAGASLLKSRTAPITMRDLGDNNITYAVSMMASTADFPNAEKLPGAQLPLRLEPVGARSVAAVQFNTTSPPVEADFLAAWDALRFGKLPKGYSLNLSSGWSPTYVLYGAENALFFTSEVWAEVVKG
jgi:hypothetical protein